MVFTSSKESCTCKKCVYCCEKRVGWFLPGEAEKLAEKMGISLQELFDKHLGVDYWTGVGDIYVLAPANVNMQPGVIFPFSIGRCGFLTESGLCSVHELGKPFECKDAFHGEEHTLSHKEVADRWNTPKHQKLIQDLLDEKKKTSKVKVVELNYGSF